MPAVTSRKGLVAVLATAALLPLAAVLPAAHAAPADRPRTDHLRGRHRRQPATLRPHQQP